VDEAVVLAPPKPGPWWWRLIPGPLRSLLWSLVPARLKRWWRSHFAGVGAYERWGYRTWGSVGAVIAIPEIWAAKWGDGPWPTISGTTGHLEDLWKPTAIFVVSIITIAAARAVKYRQDGPEPLHFDATAHATPGGRATRQILTAESTARTRMSNEEAYAYFFGSLALIALVSFVVAVTVPEGKESRFVLGYVIYGLIAVACVGVPSYLAYFKTKDVPFPTLFRTLRALESRAHIVAMIVLAGLAVLLIHLALYPWPDVSHHKPDPGSL